MSEAIRGAANVVRREQKILREALMDMNEHTPLDAYYYGFASTGQKDVDLVLSAVACAGKAYHNTSEWNDESEYPPHEGKTPVEWIQNAANKAAARIRELEEALKWYAEPQNYLDAKPEVENGQRISAPVTSIQADCGSRARAALAHR